MFRTNYEKAYLQNKASTATLYVTKCLQNIETTKRVQSDSCENHCSSNNSEQSNEQKTYLDLMNEYNQSSINALLNNLSNKPYERLNHLIKLFSVCNECHRYDDTLDIFFRLGMVFRMLQEYETAYFYFVKNYNMLNQFCTIETSAKVCYYLADVCISLNKHLEAIKYGEECLKVTTELYQRNKIINKDIVLEAQKYSVLARAWRNINEEKALNYKKKLLNVCIQYFQENKDLLEEITITKMKNNFLLLPNDGLDDEESSKLGTYLRTLFLDK